MAPRVWLLVEWIQDNNVFASYEVVNVDTFTYKDSDLQPGKQIFISLKHNDPRRAKIIRVSDNKRIVREHKDFLERQDKQVKNVLQLCMRTIKEMQSDQYPASVENDLQRNIDSQKNVIPGLPHVIGAKTENSDDSDDDTPQQSNMTIYKNQTHHQSVRYEPSCRKKGKGIQSPAVNQSRRSIMSSTPLPGKSVQENIKLCFDQGTQTDEAWSQPSMAKIEEIEIVLKHLYGRFQSLVMNVNNVNNGTIDMSECEPTGEVSYAEPNDSWVAPNTIAESVEVCQNIEDSNVNMEDIGAEQITEAEDVKVPVKLEACRKNNDKPRVRRMSAQTTYSNEMIPIGNGHAVVPARLLNEIDWRSYTTSTRQLLQAVFPRKVLATHSLTGKQSPAHLNKPPKKILDPNLVEDIIITVSSKTGIPKNLVRCTIELYDEIEYKGLGFPED